MCICVTGTVKKISSEADTVINAAGVHAVDIARMIDPQIPIKQALIRGDSLKFYL